MMRKLLGLNMFFWLSIKEEEEDIVHARGLIPAVFSLIYLRQLVLYFIVQ